MATAANSEAADSGFDIFLNAVRDEAARSMTLMRPVLAALDSYAEEPTPKGFTAAARAFDRLDMTLRRRIRDRAMIIARDNAAPPTAIRLDDDDGPRGAGGSGDPLKVDELFSLIRGMLDK